MSKKPEYSDFNIKSSIITESGPVSKDMAITLVNEDGTTFIRQTPTVEEIYQSVKAIFDTFPEGTEMAAIYRTLYVVNMMFDHTMDKVVDVLASAIHQSAVPEEMHANLCPALSRYFMNESSMTEGQDIDITDMLKQFFPEGKPH